MSVLFAEIEMEEEFYSVESSNDGDYNSTAKMELNDEHVSPEANSAERSCAVSRRCVAGVPMFYGWILVLIVSFGVLFSAPGEDFGIVVFLPYVSSELGVEQRFVDVLYLVSSIVAGIAAVPLGVAIEIAGSTRMVSCSIVGMIVACTFLGGASTLPLWATGFFIARLVGQSVLYSGNIIIVSRWFNRRRGAALGWTGFVHQLLCVDGFPIMARALIERVGWRYTYAIIGSFGAFILLPMYRIFVFSDPSDVGQRPDGSASLANRNENNVLSLSRRQIVATSWFWSYVICSFILSFFLSGLQIHLRATFVEMDISTDADQNVFLSLGITIAVLQLIAGYGSDYIARHWLLLIGAVLSLALTLVVGMFATSIATAVVYGIAMGIASGLFRIAINVAFPRLFGLQCLGFALGCASMAGTFGSSLGPLSIGVLVDTYGSHSAVFLRLLPLVLAGLAPPVVASIWRCIQRSRGN